MVILEDWSDECGQCGHPILLHKSGPCTRTQKESLEIVNKIWSDLRKRARPILASLKEICLKEKEQSLLLEGLQILARQISGQNTENVNMIVTSFIEGFSKTDGSSLSVSSPAARTTKLTKPAKVPTLTRDMTPET